MRCLQLLRTTAVATALLGMLLPVRIATATEPLAPASQGRILDVELGTGGTLQGVMVDAQGRPLAATAVEILFQGELIQRISTDDKGHFVASGLKGGTYQVAAQGHVLVVRAWMHGTAPPHAQPAILLAGGEVVRGQFWAHPWVFATVIALAIALPLGIAAGEPSPDAS